MVIIYKLRLIPGFSYFHFSEDLVIFHKDAYIDKIQLAKNKISRLSTITGNIEVKSGTGRDASNLRLNQNGIQISAQRGLEVRCPKSGKRLFPFNFSSLPLQTIKTLSVPSGVRDVEMIRSPVNEDLNVSAKDRIRIRANRGVDIEGKQINLEADSIFLASLNSSITIEGEQGVFIDMKTFKNQIAFLETSTHQNASPSDQRLPQFKLCVCGRNGRLFRIPVKDQTSSCADARFPQSENPCVE